MHRISTKSLIVMLAECWTNFQHYAAYRSLDQDPALCPVHICPVLYSIALVQSRAMQWSGARPHSTGPRNAAG
jgi:hypothetical protein